MGDVVILAIDPGPVESAYVFLRPDGVICEHAKTSNANVLREIRSSPLVGVRDHFVIEQIRSYGMAVGAEVFDTCVWSGRFCQAWMDEMESAAYDIQVHWLPRKDVKLNLCGNPRAKDVNIRQALIDRYGGKEKAIGSKKAPGPLYGISGDVWAALAVAVTFQDREGQMRLKA